MRRVLMLWVLLLTGSTLSAYQQAERKSIQDLESELILVGGIDRIHVLNEIAFKIRFQNVDKALEYAEEAVDLSTAYGQDSLKAESYYRLGAVLNLKGKQAQAVEAFLDAALIFDELDLQNRKQKISQAIGSVYVDVGQYEEASKIYFEALEQAQEFGDKEAEVFLLTRIAVIQKTLGEYRIAQRFFLEAIDKAKIYGDWVGETIALSEAGVLEELLGDNQKAIQYYESAIDIFFEKDILHGTPILYYSIADLYKDESSFDEAIDVTLKTISLADSLNNQVFVVHGYINLAKIYQAKGENEEAIQNLLLGKSIAEEAGVSSAEFDVLNLLTSNYLESGDYELASNYALEAREIASENKNWKDLESVLENLIQSEKEKGNYSSAFGFQEELLMVRDSITVGEQAKAVNALEVVYQVKQKEKEIALLLAENQRRVIVQIGLVSGLILALIIGILMIRSQKLRIQRKETELENSELRNKQLERDLEFKNKQLTTQSLNMVQKNEIMEELKEKVETVRREGSSKVLNSLSNLVDYSLSLDEDWKQFQMHFEEAHSGFYHILKDKYPDLTPNELRLSALVKLNLSIKEMATIMGISPDSVKTARYRLRKKLELKTEENLTDFMLELEKLSTQIL